MKMEPTLSRCNWSVNTPEKWFAEPAQDRVTAQASNDENQGGNSLPGVF